MRFSVIIIHRNGAQLLLDVLHAVMQAIGRNDEVIVVDNGSSDGTVGEVKSKFSIVQVIENSCNNGFARACNQGLRVSRGELILFLNNDAFLPVGSLELLIKDFAAYPRAALIGGQLVAEDGSPYRSAGTAPSFLSEIGLIRRKHPDVSNLTQPVEVETLVGACMAVRRTAVEDTGPLDEDFFFYFEETEWCVRLRRHGWTVMVDPRIRIIHLKGASTRAVRRDAQVEALRSRLLFYWKTMPALLALSLSAYRVIRLAINVAANLILVMLTLGQIHVLRDKLAIYLVQFAWLLLGVTSRPIVWSAMKQFRVGSVPFFHRLNRRLGTQGRLG